MFISGYYGIRFKLSKVLRLLGVMAYCGLILTIISSFAAGVGVTEFLLSLKRVLVFCKGGWWFVYAYMVIMFLAPVIERAIASAKENVIEVIVPILLLVFGWSYLTIIPCVGQYIPCPYGFQPLSFVSLLGVYVFARLFKIFSLADRISWLMITVCVVVSCVFALAGEWHHNSLPMLALGTCWFCIAKRAHLSKGHFSGMIAFLAPSMFTVYLLHVSNLTLLKVFNEKIVSSGYGVWVAWFASTSIMFIACVSIDLVRRLIVFVARRQVEWICSKTDYGYEVLLAKLNSVLHV